MGTDRTWTRMDAMRFVDALQADKTELESRLREAEAERSETYKLYRQALKDNADFAMRVERYRVALQVIADSEADNAETRLAKEALAHDRARGVLEKGDTG